MGQKLEKGAVVVLGSTVYLGATEEVVVPILDQESGIDEKNTHSLVITVYRAPNIKTAQASKVIENNQRDIKKALVNELSLISLPDGSRFHYVP